MGLEVAPLAAVLVVLGVLAVLRRSGLAKLAAELRASAGDRRSYDKASVVIGIIGLLVLVGGLLLTVGLVHWP